MSTHMHVGSAWRSVQLGREGGRLGAGGQLSPFPRFCISGQASEESEISKLNLAVMNLYSSRKRIEHLKKNNILA